MNLLRDLNEELIAVDRTVKDSAGALQRLAELAARDERLSSHTRGQIEDALAARERVAATALGHGVAIPHCRLDDIDAFVVGLLITPSGVDFGAPDGKPVYVFLFIVGPSERRNRHIHLLASASRALGQDEIVASLRAASSAVEARGILERALGHRPAGPVDEAAEPRCLFQAFIQDEACFEDILQAVSALVEGSIAVIEGANAGAYLHRIPLFAAYWNESRRREIRIITAFVPRDLVNEIVRRIHMVADDLDHSPGVLIAVQELLYVGGSLEF